MSIGDFDVDPPRPRSWLRLPKGASGLLAFVAAITGLGSAIFAGISAEASREQLALSRTAALVVACDVGSLPQGWRSSDTPIVAANSPAQLEDVPWNKGRPARFFKPPRLFMCSLTNYGSVAAIDTSADFEVAFAAHIGEISFGRWHVSVGGLTIGPGASRRFGIYNDSAFYENIGPKPSVRAIIPPSDRAVPIRVVSSITPVRLQPWSSGP